ncbi:DUF5916 domain-containing protein [Hymenobacter sp. B81]|uniref:DUF5916 domain-containing protein n=1 Tax=Hymenobacter sp. B81 TaxID=3344878 RepID=UPI0037DCE9CE
MAVCAWLAGEHCVEERRRYFPAGRKATPQYFDNLSSTINTPHNNSLSVRVLYFLDYADLKRRRRS